ncbi:hypothetical protein [Metabacillus sp. cB07]|uniref:hypothetical protein n=1 Tax=Metabacillus sp. cB07 TaxID=2806989 RepID=UPI00193AB965|nr:hypothetical protein [Metabacillus sp. cB07]
MLSKTSSAVVTFLFLTLFIAMMAYLDTPQAKSDETVTFPIAAEEEDQETAAWESQLVTVYEDKKIGTKWEDGYRVETYQEFEVDKDADGKTVDVRPTGNYSYLKYKGDE